MRTLNYVISLITSIAFVFTGCGKSDKEVKVGETQKVNTTKEGKSLAVDLNSSRVEWTGKKVTGKHTGTINISRGEVIIDKDNITGGSIEIDMKTIVNTDLSDKEYNNKLINHLKSDDFFSVEKFPVSKFEITAVSPYSDAQKPGYNMIIKGNLTIKGVSKGISFPANIKIDNGMVTVNADFDIDRTEFNLKYGSGKFFENLGDKMIYDDFNIKFNITARQNNENNNS
jgi:polyisoprenoid-binding protein YceI